MSRKRAENVQNMDFAYGHLDNEWEKELKISKIWTLRMGIWTIEEEKSQKCPNMGFVHGSLDNEQEKELKMSKL